MKTLPLSRQNILSVLLILAVILAGIPAAAFISPEAVYSEESIIVADPGDESPGPLSDVIENAAEDDTIAFAPDDVLISPDEEAGTGAGFGDTTAFAPNITLMALGSVSGIVTSSADDDGEGTLRYAIENAASGDIITFDSSVTEITLESALEVNKDLTIDGGGNVTLLLKDTGYRHIVVSGAEIVFTLNGMTLTGLYAGPGSDGDGYNNGGVSSTASVTINGCTIEECYIKGSGGAVNAANVTLEECRILNNMAEGDSGSNGGGGIFTDGAATLTDCTVSGNLSGNSAGGIWADDTATLTNCTVSDNTSNNSAGGISAGTVNMKKCTLSGNTANYDGGGMVGYTVVLKNCVLSDNTASGSGGAIWAYLATLTKCIVSDNTVGSRGGGIFVADTATLTGCTVSDNKAVNSGGGVIAVYSDITDCTISGNSAYYGGGAYINIMGTLTNCTVSDNTAGFAGGGIYFYTSGALINCTISDNEATDLTGGGIWAYGDTTLTSCTVSGNTAGSAGGGIYFGNNIKLLGSVVSGNYCLTDSSENEINRIGTLLNGEGLLEQVGEDVFANSAYFVIGVPAGGLSSLMDTTSKTIGGVSCDVGRLCDNGGGMETILPAAGLVDQIPVLDYGSLFTSAAAPATDQRGYSRVFSSDVDIGAVELRFAAAPVIDDHPKDLTLDQGQKGTSISVDANSIDSGTLSYQWYSNTADSNTGGTPIPNATGSAFTPPSSTQGELYYYVVVTNNKTGLDINTNPVTSQAAKVTVNKSDNNSSGTKPGTPAPGKPGGGTSGSVAHGVNNQTGHSVNTGDNSNITLWLSLVGVSLIIAAGLVRMTQRRNRT